MSIIDNEDGSCSYEYNLILKPCPKCNGTNITLFENGGRKVTEGGGRCNTKNCHFEIIESDIPGVPSMDMLLTIWNNYVDDYVNMVYTQLHEENKLSARGIV